MDLKEMGLASLAFDSRIIPDIVCGSNGLPVTPNSIKIIGCFKAQVQAVRHPSLTRYIDCFRDKNGRVTLVFEHHPNTLPSSFNLKLAASSLLNALEHLHDVLKLTHGLITPDSIVWSQNKYAKLSNWPINLITYNGTCIDSASILPRNISYLAPENVKYINSKPDSKSDIWSLALSLLKVIKPTCKIPENPARLALCDKAEKIIQLIDGLLDDKIVTDSSKWNDFFLQALDPNPESRANLTKLKQIVSEFDSSTEYQDSICESMINLEISTKDGQAKDSVKMDIAELYCLWRLSTGRNYQAEQDEDECPPIFKVPYLIVSEGQSNCPTENKLKTRFIIDFSVLKPINLDQFKNDIRSLDAKIFNPVINTYSGDDLRCKDYPLIKTCFDSPIHRNERNNNKRVSLNSLTFADLDCLSYQSDSTNNGNQTNEVSKRLPPVIKEADFAYQCERLILFNKLLSDPVTYREQLAMEASVDIPPFYRARTWTVLLNVNVEDSEELYAKTDKTAHPGTERQISVDIPRCHQYNELMASPQGHEKLARILKAWLNHNKKEYVYWQSLDSLAAPFLLINFDKEAIAFACFNAFVNKYLRGFFKQNNHLVTQQYLAMFSTLLAFHDEELAIHLQQLGFKPDLYAYPWFLTMFTHVLPLHKILHVWDRLLLGNEKFPMCIGIAILNQNRHELLNYTYDDCIAAFSDLPDIDIERCIRDATYFYNSTPSEFR